MNLVFCLFFSQLLQFFGCLFVPKLAGDLRKPGEDQSDFGGCRDTSIRGLGREERLGTDFLVASADLHIGSWPIGLLELPSCSKWCSNHL